MAGMTERFEPPVGRRVETDPPTPERPEYRASEQAGRRLGGTNLFMVVVDEGWRECIVCTGMYEWAADWLISQIQGKPFAPGTRP